ncbi:hypothetical protein Tco_1514173 [Tanacetum coccineum]
MHYPLAVELTFPRLTCRFRIGYCLLLPYLDTMDTRVRDTERRMMVVVEVVNLRVSHQADVRRRESSELYLRHHKAQEDRSAVRAEIKILRRERLGYEQESIETR